MDALNAYDGGGPIRVPAHTAAALIDLREFAEGGIAHIVGDLGASNAPIAAVPATPILNEGGRQSAGTAPKGHFSIDLNIAGQKHGPMLASGDVVELLRRASIKLQSSSIGPSPSWAK